MGEEMIIPGRGGESFMAYCAMPKKTPAPAIIVIQEIFGVNQVMRDLCDWLASEGYMAVCPDLFWRMEPNVQLTDKTEEDWAKAFDFFNRFDVDKGIEDLRSTHHTLKGHALCNGKVGSIGYCLGGKLAFLMAARSSVDASVGYYGVGLDALLDEAKDIKAPLMLHIAEEDKFVPKDAQAKIKDALKKHPSVTIHNYPGKDHAFAREGGEHYDSEAAHTANARSLEFLANALELKMAA